MRALIKGGREVPYQGGELESNTRGCRGGKGVVDGVPNPLRSRGSVSVCTASMSEMISCQTKQWKSPMPRYESLSRRGYN